MNNLDMVPVTIQTLIFIQYTVQASSGGFVYLFSSLLHYGIHEDCGAKLGLIDK